MKFENISEWINNKPMHLATLSVIIALNAEQFHLLLNAAENPKFKPLITPDNAEHWLGLYKNHRHVRKVLIKEGLPFTQRFSDANATASQLISLVGSGAHEQKKFKTRYEQAAESEKKKVAHDLQSLCLGLIENSIENQTTSSKQTNNQLLAEWEKISHNKYLTFIFGVWFPCWLQFGKLPTILFYKARHGDANALAELLTVDKNALFDPRIKKHFNAASKNLDSRIYRQISKGLSSGITGKNKLKKTKYNLAGLIAALADYFDFKLTHTDIRALFDAIRRDLFHDPCDFDLPDGEDAFRKAVKHHKDFWKESISKMLVA